MQELVLMIDNQKKVRIIIGKIGLDPHDRGVLVLSKILTDAGMEVIYLGRFQTAEAVVRAAIEEDAQIIALSDHCGGLYHGKRHSRTGKNGRYRKFYLRYPP